MRRAMLFLSLITACGDTATDPKPPPPQPPPFDTKSDAFRRTDFKGVLDGGATGRGIFREDIEFHGWAFDVHEAGAVDLAVTHAGTTAALDTTLFVFGPLRFHDFGSQAVAWDDDSGWSRLSRVHTVLEPGRYLGVVGTANGAGRGHYQIRLRCSTQTCGAPDTDLEGCPEGLDDWIATCVDKVATDLWVTHAVAWDQCSSELHELPVRVELCKPSPFRSTPPWCAAFISATDECRAVWDERLFPESPVATTPVSVPVALDEVEQTGEAACGRSCGVVVHTFKYASDEPATPDGSVGAVVRDLFDADVAWQNQGEAPRAALEERLATLEMSALVPAAVERSGSELFHVGHARHSQRPRPFRPTDDELWVLTFPDAGWIVALEIVHF